MAAILDIGTILAIFDLQVTSKLLPSFTSIGLSVQEKKGKIGFLYGGQGGYLGFLIGMILAYVWSTSHPDASYQK